MSICGCELIVGSGEHALSTDAGNDALVEDASVSVDAGRPPLGPQESGVSDDGGPPNPGVNCGLDYCTPGAQACCVGACTAVTQCAVRDDAGAFDCRPRSGENCGWGVFQCDDAADCAQVAGGGTGTVCCGVANHSRCIRLVDCQTQPHVIYCDPLAAMPCPQGASCVTVDGGRPRCDGG